MKKTNETKNDCLLWDRKLRGFFKAFSEEFRRDYGLKQIDLEILFYLHYNPKASIGEISRNQSLNKGQLSLAMTELKENGYIDAIESEQDKRYQIYHLTPAAEKLWERIVASKMQMRDRLYDGLTDEERATFEKLVRRIGANIDKMLEEKQ
ncbi:MAG: transcriptional regulator [Lachnospiraceae bacterium]|nr:transcriptional regulator [Lachnospiraceae bacterium]